MLTVPEATLRARHMLDALDGLDELADVVLVLSYAIAGQRNRTLGAAAASLVHYADGQGPPPPRPAH
jgi:hypothetical protein